MFLLENINENVSGHGSDNKLTQWDIDNYNIQMLRTSKRLDGYQNFKCKPLER